ncbi:hypothetical protein ACOME3_006592 [Neoechinorhynchus agilis]
MCRRPVFSEIPEKLARPPLLIVTETNREFEELKKKMVRILLEEEISFHEDEKSDYKKTVHYPLLKDLEPSIEHVDQSDWTNVREQDDDSCLLHLHCLFRIDYHLSRDHNNFLCSSLRDLRNKLTAQNEEDEEQYKMISKLLTCISSMNPIQISDQLICLLDRWYLTKGSTFEPSFIGIEFLKKSLLAISQMEQIEHVHVSSDELRECIDLIRRIRKCQRLLGIHNVEFKPKLEPGLVEYPIGTWIVTGHLNQIKNLWFLNWPPNKRVLFLLHSTFERLRQTFLAYDSLHHSEISNHIISSHEHCAYKWSKLKLNLSTTVDLISVVKTDLYNRVPKSLTTLFNHLLMKNGVIVNFTNTPSSPLLSEFFSEEIQQIYSGIGIVLLRINTIRRYIERKFNKKWASRKLCAMHFRLWNIEFKI